MEISDWCSPEDEKYVEIALFTYKILKNFKEINSLDPNQREMWLSAVEKELSLMSKY